VSPPSTATPIIPARKTGVAPQAEIVVWEDRSSPTVAPATTPVEETGMMSTKAMEVHDENTAPSVDV
ncbi:hypothetical protein LTR53_015525, partial [Teratosphaeriaceae sp. CCFEE 6253]